MLIDKLLTKKGADSMFAPFLLWFFDTEKVVFLHVFYKQVL